MFTGLIEEIGKLEEIRSIGEGRRIRIGAGKILQDCHIDDSVAVNGICLTVTDLGKGSFWVDVVGDTLHKTTASRWHVGDKVNLERALRPVDRLGGHLVLGHVNGMGQIKRLSARGKHHHLEIELPHELMRYCIDEGSIAIDGISLTIAGIVGNCIRISVIPHTFTNTNLPLRRVGDYVNVEVDMIARHIERLLIFKQKTASEETISEVWLKKQGY